MKFLVFISLLLPSLSLARAPVSSSPRDVVQKYLAADFAGSRVFKEGHAATSQYVTWSEEPPWDQVIIVGRYTLLKTKVRRRMAKIGVKYVTLGELKGDVFYPESSTEEATFEAIRRGRQWRVDRPILVPHISRSSAEKYLKDQLKSSEPNSEHAKQIEKALSDLESLNARN